MLRSVVLLAFVSVAPLAGCATVSVYEPVAAEISLTEDQSMLRKLADAYCKDAREKGLATGEASLTALADMLTGKESTDGSYWKRIGADRSAPASVVSRVRADMSLSAKGLSDLETMARSLMTSSKPTRSDVSEFERALIRERQREGIALAKQRGAYRGRKKSLPSERIAELRQRVEAGEQKTKLAREFGISRETLYQYLMLISTQK